MSRPPYFPFYPAQFMTGVRGLSPAEVGVYTMLLCRIYESSGAIENSTVVLAAYCGCRPSTFEKALSRLMALGKIKTDGETLWNDRAMEEIDARAKRMKIAERAGEKSAEKRKENQGWQEASVQRSLNHGEETTSVAKATDADGVVDFAEAIWTRGVAYLTRNGTKEKQARAMIGKWRKANGDRAVFEALASASKAGVSEPVAYITAALKEPSDQKLDAWGIPDAKPVRVEPRVADQPPEAPAGAADLPRVQFQPEGGKSEGPVSFGDPDRGWIGDPLPPLRALSGCLV